MSKVEEVLLKKILFIGDSFPYSLIGDSRPKFIVLGTPAEFMEEVNASCKSDHPHPIPRPKSNPTPKIPRNL